MLFCEEDFFSKNIYGSSYLTDVSKELMISIFILNTRRGIISNCHV